MSCDTAKMIALAYRTHRQFDATHGHALEAAVKVYGQLHPEALPHQARRAVITILAHAACDDSFWTWHRAPRRRVPLWDTFPAA